MINTKGRLVVEDKGFDSSKSTSYEKLVRDKIPDIIRKEGKKCRITTLSEEAFIKQLFEKLLEEAKELNRAYWIGDKDGKQHERIMEEFCDVYEVLDEIAQGMSIAREDIEILRDKKREERGGFKDRTFLVDVSE